VAEIVYISLGSNLGDREKYLASARSRIGVIEGIEVVAVSSIYLTQPIHMASDAPSFLNQVIKVEYLYTPGELLQATETIEQDMGRTDKGKRLPRTIDIDLLLFGTRIVSTERLKIPHPEILKRPFVLVPLLQIDLELTHPVTGKQLSTHLKSGDIDSVIIYKDHVARNV